MANPAMKIISRPTAEYVDSPATMKGTFTKSIRSYACNDCFSRFVGCLSCRFTSSVWYIGFRHDCGRSTYNSDLL